MLLNLKYFLFGCVLYATSMICSEKVTYYMVTQRPAVTFLNHSYITYANVSSRRHGRGNPIYYIDCHFKSVVPLDNTFKLDIYLYEFLSNEYRRSFVEMHFKVCDMIHNDKLFSTIWNQVQLQQPCPYPPGDYHLYNISVPSAIIPRAFPFTKGRIYANMSRGEDYICGTEIDMELKMKLIKSAGHENKKSVLQNFS